MEPECKCEEAPDKPKMKDILQNKWPVIFKSMKVMKTEETLSNHLV